MTLREFLVAPEYHDFRVLVAVIAIAVIATAIVTARLER